MIPKFSLADATSGALLNLISANQATSAGEIVGCYTEFKSFVVDNVSGYNKKILLVGGFGLMDSKKGIPAGYFKINGYKLPDDFTIEKSFSDPQLISNSLNNIFDINYAYFKVGSFDSNKIYKKEFAYKTDSNKGFFLAIPFENYTDMSEGLLKNFSDKNGEVVISFNMKEGGIDIKFNLKDNALLLENNNSWDDYIMKNADCELKLVQKGIDRIK